MSTQGDLLAQEAIAQVEEHADDRWLAAAKRVLWDLIKEGQDFTSDECWQRLEWLEVSTREPRAMGAVIRAARRAGYITTTGEYRKTTRPEAHSRPVPVWRPTGKQAAA